MKPATESAYRLLHDGSIALQRTRCIDRMAFVERTAKRNLKGRIIMASRKPKKQSIWSIKWIRIDQLEIDPRYQRSEKPAHIKMLADAFDVGKCLPKVGERPDGKTFLIDGQQRVAAARRNGIVELQCAVRKVANAVEEAQLFDAENRIRKPLHPSEKFTCRLFGKEPIAVAIQSAVTKHGFKLRLTTNPKLPEWPELSAVQSLERIFLKEDGHLEAVLDTINTYWPHLDDALSSEFLLALSKLISMYELNPAIMERNLSQRCNPQVLINLISRSRNPTFLKRYGQTINRGQSGGVNGLFFALMDQYNRETEAADQLQPPNSRIRRGRITGDQSTILNDQIKEMVDSGLSANEIANRCSISYNSAKSRMNRLKIEEIDRN